MENTESVIRITNLKNKKTGETVTSDMLFLNDYSDGGAKSLYATLLSIMDEWDVVD